MERRKSNATSGVGADMDRRKSSGVGVDMDRRKSNAGGGGADMDRRKSNAAGVELDRRKSGGAGVEMDRRKESVACAAGDLERRKSSAVGAADTVASGETQPTGREIPVGLGERTALKPRNFLVHILPTVQTQDFCDTHRTILERSKKSPKFLIFSQCLASGYFRRSPSERRRESDVTAPPPARKPSVDAANTGAHANNFLRYHARKNLNL